MAHQPHHHRSESHDAEHHGIGHVVPPRILIATASALLVLTVITVAAAKVDFARFDLQELNIIVALAIAVVKGSIVCLFFMHLRWDRPFNAFVLVASLAAVALFIGFAMLDTAEYQREIIKGDSEVIKTKLTALPAPGTPPPADEAH